MTSTGGGLPQHLKSITDIKITELSKQHALFERQRLDILKATEDAPDLRSKAQTLLEGITRLKGNPNDAFDQEDLDLDHQSEAVTAAVQDGSERATHANIRRFLLQSQYDPSVSNLSLTDWVAELEQELSYLQLRHNHAAFYAKMVTECLEAVETQTPSANTKDASTEEDTFEPVGRAEMQEQRAIWESLVFKKPEIDKGAVHNYLDRLFTSTSLSRQALKELREKIKSFGTELGAKKTWISLGDMDWISQTLLKSDLLTKEKTAVLKEFMRNKAVAQEVTDVLNMRLATLKSWGWPADGVPVEMRRQLNGKNRVFMDEDLLDALMLQYLGLKWSISFREAFTNFLNSRAWSSLRHNVPSDDKKRRAYCLTKPGPSIFDDDDSVNLDRFKVYKRDYFMTQLPSSVDDDTPDYDDEASMSRTHPAKARGKQAIDTKHSLLHLLITESIVQTTLHGQFTVLRSDFKWFGPSMPHETMMIVLEYFGVPQDWLEFFKTFLKCPIKFVQDGPDASVQTRQCGVPMSHTLSTCFGEAVLFCMDYAVNQCTDGANLYRLHDDFWFWGHEDSCILAWNAMTEFARVMGLEFNEEKTGTVRLKRKTDNETRGDTYTAQPNCNSPNQESNDLQKNPLPTGEIRWGFLKLDPDQGRFIIDQGQVDDHISELQRQLSACTSVFSWVQAWNSYFGRFFANNFAKPAMCFGRSHIDMAISTLSRIERSLFPDSPSGVTGHLRNMVADRFDVQDLPEAFFYFPVELGGLELLNPYVSLLLIRENIKQSSHGRLQKAFIKDLEDYDAAKERFHKYYGSSQTFMTMEEFTKHAEEYSWNLLNAYRDLTRKPEEVSINQTPALQRYQTLLSVGDSGSCSSISGDWDAMTPYWRWIAEVYQGEMVKRYGSLAAVSREFMPLGVIKTLKEGKFRWQG
ncbi:hypothetical protein FE257_011597 [Aspergillus nanangensis]|uniref:Reverse transcriptase domain-containing protein n=1 Tax=Aspergillus nanangensis TaxID=2582783 RepID=A0AAD4CIF4_ASPNN|nr:hypothetical protein FE257_011597 [Aspergillus nanangensis]